LTHDFGSIPFPGARPSNLARFDVESKKHSPRAVFRSLRRNLRKREKLSARVEKAAARLERRRIKLQTLEARIADLGRRMARPHNGGSPSRGGVLEPARLIFSPSSGHGRDDDAARLSEIVQSLRAHGIDARIGLKTSGKAARSLARDAVRSGHPLVVVAAGDGTIEAVASQLVGSSTTLGIVPTGNNNNLARSLGVPLDIGRACALISKGIARHIDVGRVVSSARPDVTFFLEGAGVGLSAMAALAGPVDERRRWRVMPGALRELSRTRQGTVRVAIDGADVEGTACIVMVSNAPLMGNNLLVAPDAKMDDGWFDITIYDGIGEGALIQRFVTGVEGGSGQPKTYRARHVRILSEESVVGNAGMTVAGRQRVVEIEMMPKALSVIVGDGIGLSLPLESPRPAVAVTESSPHTNGSAEVAIAAVGKAGS
jgi:diacylglycerol kinase (ATP)